MKIRGKHMRMNWPLYIAGCIALYQSHIANSDNKCKNRPDLSGRFLPG